MAVGYIQPHVWWNGHALGVKKAMAWRHKMGDKIPASRKEWYSVIVMISHYQLTLTVGTHSGGRFEASILFAETSERSNKLAVFCEDFDCVVPRIAHHHVVFTRDVHILRIAELLQWGNIVT